MGQPVNRSGSFRILIQEYSLYKADTGAVKINVRARILALYEDDGWQDWEPYECDVEGGLWVVKKDGKLNNYAAEPLVKYTGWDGNFESVANGTWKPVPCGATVNLDVQRSEKEGKDFYRIDWINSYDYTPGGGGNVDAAGIKELNTRFGSQLRALAGSAKANGSKPSGKPPAPPNPNKELQDVAETDGDDIPF